MVDDCPLPLYMIDILLALKKLTEKASENILATLHSETIFKRLLALHSNQDINIHVPVLGILADYLTSEDKQIT